MKKGDRGIWDDGSPLNPPTPPFCKGGRGGISSKIITYSFCESFKDRLVDFIRTQYIDQGRDLSRLAVVFGGRRPALFLKRELAGIVQKSFYPPVFFTIDEFVAYTVKKAGRFISPRIWTIVFFSISWPGNSPRRS